MRRGSDLIPLILLMGALAVGGCADNEYGEDERAIGVDDTPNAVAEPGFGESPIEGAGVGEGEEEFGSATGGVMGEDVEVPLTDREDEERPIR